MAKSYFKEVAVVIKEKELSKLDKLLFITKRISNGITSTLLTIHQIHNLIANAIKLKEKLRVKLSLSVFDEDVGGRVTIGYADNELECDFTDATKITGKKLAELENQLVDWIVNKMEANKWTLFDKYQDIAVDITENRFSITCWFNVSPTLFDEVTSSQKEVKQTAKAVKPTSDEADNESDSSDFEIDDDEIPF